MAMPRVLIVDDSRVVLSIVQTYLAELGVAFDVATSAEAALLRFREAPPDLVVTDVMMPGMNGIEFARRVKTLSSGRVKVVLISSVARDKGSVAVDRGLVEAFIHKPIDGDKLCDTVASLLGLPRRSGTNPTLSAAHTPVRASPVSRGRVVRRGPVRLLIADDTQVGIGLLQRLIEADDRIELVATARNAREVIEKALGLKPDLVLLDAGMPSLDTTEVVRRIVEPRASRVLMIAERHDPNQCDRVFAALGAGAVDVLLRPAWGDPEGEQALAFRQRLKTFGRPALSADARPRPQLVGLDRDFRAGLVAIHAGAGTFRPLLELLGRIGPAVQQVPFVLSQELPEGYDEACAEWLAKNTKLAIRLMVDRDAIAPGAALLAPAGLRPLIGRKRIDLPTESTSALGWSAADALFESASRAFGSRLLAVTLGGVSEDGLAGLRRVKEEQGALLVLDPERSPSPALADAAMREGLVDAALDNLELGIEILRACAPRIEASETGRHRVR